VAAAAVAMFVPRVGWGKGTACCSRDAGDGGCGVCELASVTGCGVDMGL